MIDRAAVQRYIEDRSIPIPMTGCWMWMLAPGPHGYGMASWQTANVLAHRLSYFAFVGPIPEGMLIQHSCDSPWCVAPHLIGAQR